LKRQLKRFGMGARFLAGQVGTTTGRAISMPLLLETHELPGDDWQLRREATLRLGSVRPANEVELRAKKRGSVVALRLFDSTTSSLTLAIRILVLASPDDASLWISTLQEKMITEESSSIRSTKPTLVDGIEVPEFGITRGLTFVLSTNGPPVVKEVAGAVDSVAFVVRILAEDDSCPWTQLLEFAQLQGAKIAEATSPA